MICDVWKALDIVRLSDFTIAKHMSIMLNVLRFIDDPGIWKQESGSY